MRNLINWSSILLDLVVGILGIIVYWGNLAGIFGMIMFCGLFMLIPAFMWEHDTSKKAC